MTTKQFTFFGTSRQIGLLSIFCLLFFFFPAMAQTPFVTEYKLQNGATALLAPRPGSGAVHAAWLLAGGHSDTGNHPPVAADLLLATWLDDPVASSAPGFWMVATADGMAHGRDITPESLEAWCSAEVGRLRQSFSQDRATRAKRRLELHWQTHDPLEDLYALALGGTSYAVSERKNLESLAPLTNDDLFSLSQKLVTPERVLIVLAGDIEEGMAIAALNKHFGRLESSGKALPKAHDASSEAKPLNAVALQTADDPAQASANSNDSLVHEQKREISVEAMTEVFIAWSIPPLFHSDRPAMDIFAEILLGNTVSSLKKYLVDELGCANGIEILIGVPGGRSASLFVIRVAVADGHNMHEIESAIQHNIQHTLSYGMEDIEIDRALYRLGAKHAVGLASAQGLAQSLIRAYESAGNWRLALEEPANEIRLEPLALMPILQATFQPEFAFCLLAERDPILLPRSPSHAHIIALLSWLLREKTSDASQSSRLIKDALRQFIMMPAELRQEMVLLVEAEVRQ